MRLLREKTRIIDPVDRWDCDDFCHQKHTVCLNRIGADRHDENLDPHGILLDHPVPATFNIEVFGKVFGVEVTILNLLVDHGLIESDRVLVHLPDWLEVILENDGNHTHDRQDHDDQVGEVAIWSPLVTIGAANGELRLPLENGHEEAGRREETDKEVQVQPVAIVVVILLNQLSSDELIVVLGEIFI